MFEKQILTIHEEKQFATSISQRIKNMVWNVCGTTAEVDSRSFDTDDFVDVNLYFTATEKQMETLVGTVKHLFPELSFDIKGIV